MGLKKKEYIKKFYGARGLSLKIEDLMRDISEDIRKYWCHGNSHAGKRARVNSIKLEKLMKKYRLMTIKIDNNWKCHRLSGFKGQ